MTRQRADAVLALAFGGPGRPEDVRPFLEHVARGRPIAPDRLDEVARHYQLMGGRSPLTEITFRQAEALRRVLRTLPVYVGMRHWTPYVADTMATMVASGVREAVGLVLSPFASEASRDVYQAEVEAARATLGPRAPAVRWAGAWYGHAGFAEAMADRIAAAGGTDDALLLFTAHSLPCDMAARGPYATEYAAAAAAVAARLGTTRWELAYQSRSGRPTDPWLEPDVNEALRRAAAAGARRVVLAPIGFVCDHVEVLYDLDVEAARTAAAAGLTLARAGTVGDHPSFIAALADAVRGVA